MNNITIHFKIYTSEKTKRMYQIFVIFAIILCNLRAYSTADVFSNNGKLNTTEMAAKYGHPTEEHNVTTEDGYILALHRLPGKGLPILMMHGVADTSKTWLIRGNNSLGITLANLGHDVWIGDCRGNMYSRGHISLDADNNASAYWDFTFYETGYYDLPAFIDYILKETGYKKLNAIGHSQGSTVFFVMGSTRPEYNDKVNALISLAPIAFLSNLPPPMSNIIAISPAIYRVAIGLHQYELFGNTAIGLALRSICLQPVTGYPVCTYGLLFPLSGFDPAEYEYAFHYELFQVYPASTSSKTLYHFAQVSSRGNFSQFDYGSEENLKRYGSESAPDFDLSKVTIPVALICGRNDKISTLDDIAKLLSALPNVIQYTVVERKQANHLDLIWGRRMDRYLFPHIFDVIKNYF